MPGTIASMHISTKTFLLGLIAFLFTGCVAVKYTPPLQSELSGGGANLLYRYGLRIQGTPGSEPLGELQQYMRDDRSALPVDYEEGYKTGFQCFDPVLYVLTLGIVPQDCAQNVSVAVQVREGAKTNEYEMSYRKVQITGWAAPFLWLLPSWEFGTDVDAKERSIITLINGVAVRQLTAAVQR